MPYYRFINKETGEEIEELMPHAELAAYTEAHPELQRVFEFPKISTSNSATFLDGHAPESRKKAIATEKKIADLTAQSYNLPHDKRGEINEEIKKVKATRKAPIGANKGSK